MGESRRENGYYKVVRKSKKILALKAKLQQIKVYHPKPGSL
jgi:hypothetical protein